MNRVTLVFLFLLFYSNSFSQEVYELHLTSDFRYTDQPNYTYTRLLQLYKDVWAFTDYDRKKNKVQTGFFTDSTLVNQTGRSRFYQNNKLLFEGVFDNGRRIGWWYFYNKKEELADSLFYTIPESRKNVIDSIEKKTVTISTEHLRDTSALFYKVETEADFKGGVDGWRKFLTKTLRFPDLASEILPPGQKKSIIQFVVCTDGVVCDLQVVESSHPLLDLEAVKTIQKGGNWTPAEQNGKKVKAYRKQPITFVLE